MNNACILCKNKKSQLLYTINGFDITRCNKCGFISTTPLPTKKQLDVLYKNFKFETGFVHEQFIRRDARRMLDNLKHLGKTKGNLLDLGCGAGFLLDEAQKIGWKTLGVDTASLPLKYAKEKLHVKVIKKDMYTFRSKTRFNAIVLSQVIEHLTTPYPILNKIKTLLADDGIVCISTPNITSHLAITLKEKFNYLIPPEHLLYFSPQTLTQILEKSGFTVVKIITYGYPEDFASIYRLLKEKLNNSSSLPSKHGEKTPKSKNQLTKQHTSIIKKIKSYVFENIVRNSFYFLLNLGLKGSIIEIYVKKRQK